MSRVSGLRLECHVYVGPCDCHVVAASVTYGATCLLEEGGGDCGRLWKWARFAVVMELDVLELLVVEMADDGILGRGACCLCCRPTRRLPDKCSGGVFGEVADKSVFVQLSDRGEFLDESSFGGVNGDGFGGKKLPHTLMEAVSPEIAVFAAVAPRVAELGVESGGEDLVKAFDRVVDF